MLRTYEKKIGFDDSFDVTWCLQQFVIPDLLHMWVEWNEQPYNIKTMVPEQHQWYDRKINYINQKIAPEQRTHQRDRFQPGGHLCGQETVAELGARSVTCLEWVEGEEAGQGQLPAPGRGEAHWHDEAPHKIHPSKNSHPHTQSTARHKPTALAIDGCISIFFT